MLSPYATATFDLSGRPTGGFDRCIYFNPMLRHLDVAVRKWTTATYLKHEYVFGATAAAAPLPPGDDIDHISLDGELPFDSDSLCSP